MVFLVIMLLAVLGSACGGPSSGSGVAPATPVVSTAPEVKPTAAPTQPAAAPVTIRVAVLPILDALPMYAAQKEGLFEKNGVKVELVPVASAAERDQIITAGQAEAMINEVVSTILYNKDKIQVQIVRYARSATADAPMYRILASAKSGITDVNGLKGAEIGISQGTVIDYLTDRLLTKEGLTKDDIKTVAVPKIPDRLALLSSGEIKGAMLPDPTASLAILQGAKVIVDDTKHPELGYSTIAFRKEFIDKNPQAVKGFLAALEQAVQEINANPTQWNQLMSDQKLVPAPLLATFKLPKFVTTGVPTQAQWDDVLAWMKDKGLVKVDVAYKDSVTIDYLPK
jgi:NitT/TauT family transport system substrate-binding protein